MVPVTNFLISGATGQMTSASIAVEGMNKFTFIASAGNAIAGTIPTGTVNLLGTVDGSMAPVAIFSNTFNGASGIVCQVDGPWLFLSASLTSQVTGIFTGALMYWRDTI